MNCVHLFRFSSSWKVLPRLLLMISYWFHQIHANPQSFLNDNDDNKRVFDRTFAEKQTYQIDDCIPLAFGDFDANKIVDIFCRTTKGDSIRVMLNDDRSPSSNEKCHANIPGMISDVLAGDYDGDSKLDLFVLYKTNVNQTVYNGGFLWGDRIGLSDLQPINYSFQTIPTTLDANGDSLVDLLGMISKDQLTYQPACLTFSNRNVDSFIILTNVDDLRPNSTQATVDLNSDLVAELFLTINSNDQPIFRLYELPITNMALITEYNVTVNATIYHLSTFADIDADGVLEHILPICIDRDCSISQIYVRDDNQWSLLPIPFGEGVRFPLIDQLPSPFDQTPLSIKIADYNLDGYPDMVMIMNQSGIIAPMIFRNEECSKSTDGICTYTRTFKPQTVETVVASASNATLVAFFDILENGYPDILVVQKNTDETFQLTGFQNALVQDVQFLKVMVLSQFSCNACSHQEKLPYGNDQPGQLVIMETLSSTDGISDRWIKLAAIQMAQSGQFTLELPYVIIGLGATANFVEKVTVSIPPNKDLGKLNHIYTQMIPNSQIVIIPVPLSDPSRWQSKLFVIPSRMILHTGIALCVTLFIIIGVLAGFQHRERLEDKRERKVQSQRFHYDAL